MLHVSNNEALIPRIQMKPILNSLTTRFYTPEENLTIYEPFVHSRDEFSFVFT
jgi:hypothetical protein